MILLVFLHRTAIHQDQTLIHGGKEWTEMSLLLHVVTWGALSSAVGQAGLFKAVLLPTEGGCSLYLVADSAGLWLGFVFIPFIIFPFQSKAILTYLFSLVIFKHLYPWGCLEQTG